MLILRKVKGVNEILPPLSQNLTYLQNRIIVNILSWSKNNLLNSNKNYPVDNVTPLLSHLAPLPCYELSPYHLKIFDPEVNKEILFENFYQSCKVFSKMEAQHQGGYANWVHGEEIHCVDDKITPEYLNWRKKVRLHQCPLRYPAGYQDRSKVLFSYYEGRRLTYLEARKQIYCANYERAVHNHQLIKYLRELLRQGFTLEIIDVDLPGVSAFSIDENDKFILEYNKYIVDTSLAFGHSWTVAKLILA